MRGRSVLDLIRHRGPMLKNLQRFIAKERSYRYGSGLKIIAAKFLIDKCVIKAGVRGVVTVGCDNNTLGPGPINCTEAHRARFARCINDTAFKLK